MRRGRAVRAGTLGLASLLGVISGFCFVTVRHHDAAPASGAHLLRKREPTGPGGASASGTPASVPGGRDTKATGATVAAAAAEAAATAEATAPVGIVEGILDRPRGDDDIHLVFSTDCSPYQSWQSMVLFHSARESGQTGRITRIASGCTEEEQQSLRDLHKHMPSGNQLHFTPDFTIHGEMGEAFPYNNKPNGILHFLKYASPAITATVVALLDPDQIVMRKITPRLDELTKYRPGHPDAQVRGPDAEWVTRGHPVAQSYGYGAQWAVWPDLENIVPPDSPVFQMDAEQANKFYTAGPPYLMHASDWLRVAELWANYTPPAFKGHPGILADMEAWSLAAVGARLPHTVVYSLMASDLEGGSDEEWRVVDGLPREHACISPADFRALDGTRGENDAPRPIPAVLHYCQLYRNGLYMFAKRHKDLHNIFRCDGPLLMEPPPHVTTMSTKVHPHAGGPRIEPVTQWQSQRQTAALCLAIKSTNAALTDYRDRSCTPKPEPWIMHLTDLQPGDLAQVDRWKELNVI